MPIGSLNGAWAVTFKAVLAFSAFALPSILSLNAWFVATIYDIRIGQAELQTKFKGFVDVGPRYTRAMAVTDNLLMKEAILGNVEQNYPPAWLIKDLGAMERRLKALEER